MLELLTVIIPLLPAAAQFVIGVLLLVVVIVRARSSHVLLSFLWRKVMGDPPTASNRVRLWAQQREAWVYFRAQSGIAVRTLQHAERLIRLAHRHDEEVADIARCGG